MNKLEAVETHFEFGKNWSDYSEGVTDETIREATEALEKLCGPVEGLTFLDIGCGSGLHSLAAIKLGAKEVYATDIDPASVETTKKLLEKHAPDAHFKCEVKSVFNLDRASEFDVVYSWGVLHHTGDMYKAIRCARKAAKPEGKFVIALYTKTSLCWLWKIEKWLYVHSPTFAQNLICKSYIQLFKLACFIKGKNFDDYINQRRGMNFHINIKDWLGGYPYESISEAEMLNLAGDLDLELQRSFTHGPLVGVAGSVCDEYVFKAI